MTQQNLIGELAASFIILLVGLAVISTIQGGDPDDTLLSWFSSHPDIFGGIIIVLIVVGGILSLGAQR